MKRRSFLGMLAALPFFKGFKERRVIRCRAKSKENEKYAEHLESAMNSPAFLDALKKVEHDHMKEFCEFE